MQGEYEIIVKGFKEPGIVEAIRASEATEATLHRCS